MTKEAPKGTFKLLIIGSWLAVIAVTLLMSKPLFFAWSHDPYLDLGEYCFGLWLVAAALHWNYPEGKWEWSRITFVLGAAALLFLGILGELQALIYLALSLLLSLPVRGFLLRHILMLSGLVWMPLWAWVLGPYLGSSLGGISLGLAVLITLLSIAIRFRSYVSKANTPTV